MKPYLEGKTVTTLTEAANYIDRLKREVELLTIKAKGFDALAGMIALLARGNQASWDGPDASHVLRTLVAEIQGASKAEEEAAALRAAERAAAEGLTDPSANADPEVISGYKEI